MYNAGLYMSSKGIDREALHRIRDNQSRTRNEVARQNMSDLKDQRIIEHKPSPRYPVLVSRNMEELPMPGIY